MKKRTTVYLDDKVLKMLKIRSIHSNQSVSDYINQTMYSNMMEEKNDLVDISAIIKEPTMPFGKMLDKLGITDEV